MSFFSAIKSLFGFSKAAPATLQPGDRMLTCEDCKTQFVFDVGEQRFFKEKGFTEPKRCPKCRKKVRFRIRRRGRGQGGDGGQDGENQSNHQQHGNHSNRNNNQGNHGRRNRHHGRKHSVIDGDSPYADER
jgi:RNase P subunit RPR2